MNRRFVNLVLADYDSRMYSLFRLDVAKHLFYPSTAQAEAANAAKQEETNNGSGSDNPPTMKWPKPPTMKWLRPLPKPTMRFFSFDGGEERRRRKAWSYYDDAFMLLRPGSSDGTILHATKGDRTVIYDADTHAISATVPFFDKGMGQNPIAFSVPGGAGEKEESLYVMRSTITSPVRDRFSAPPRNNGGSSGGEDGCSGDFVVLDFNNQPDKWQPLPRPPFVVEEDRYESKGSLFKIRSSAVIDDGRTIVMSCEQSKGSYGGGGGEFTYCFDTTMRQWRHAGDWKLPFAGRAEYVPHLGTWIGLSSSPPHHLCAADLSSAMDAGDRPPTPQHVWDDFTPPPYEESEVVLNQRFPDYVLKRSTDWRPYSEHSLVNLGSGRFCILKVFSICQSEWIFWQEAVPDAELFAVITGVEVVRCNDGEEGGLRMVKHKSRRCPISRMQQHRLF